MAFDVGSIVAKLELDKKNWDMSVKSVEKQQTSMAGFAEKHGAAMKKMGMAMTAAGAAIVGGLTLAVKAFAGFDKSMVESLAIMGDIPEEIKKSMAEAALAMSKESTFAAKELADAFYYLASAGMSAEQSIAALPAVTRFAQAGAFDLATATDLLTDAQTAMGLSSKDVEENQKNLVDVSDKLVKANTLANASVQQFAEALTNKASAALVNVNKNMDEGVAVLAAFADKGVKGQIAGNQLAMMLNALDIAAMNNKEAWEKNGIALFDNQGAMRPLGDLIGDMEGLLGAMTVEQKSATLASLGFTVRTKASILTLMGSSEKIKIWTEDLKNAGGTTEEVANKQLLSFSNQMIVLKNTVTAGAIELGEKLAPTIASLAKTIGTVVEAITDWIDEHPVLTGVVLKVVAGLGALMLVLGPLLMILPGLVAGIGLISAGFIAAAASVTAAIAVFGFAITKIVKLIEVLGDLKTAKDYAEGATIRLEEAEGKLNDKLELIAERAGLTADEFQILTDKYDGNTNALAYAILKGEEGVKLQEAMKEVGDLNVKTQEDLTGALEDETVALEDGSAATDALTKSLILLNPELFDAEGKVKLLKTAMVEMKTPTELLQKAVDDYTESMKEIPIELDQVRPEMEDIIGGIGISMDDMNAKALLAAGITSETMLATVNANLEAAELQAEKTQEIINGVADSIGNVFGQSAIDILEGQRTLGEAIGDIWGGIKSTIFGVIGDIVKEFVGNLVKSVLTGAINMGKGMSKAGDVMAKTGKAISGIGEGIGKLIEGLAVGIGKAIEALAKSIAAAAKSLAAAAPQLIVVGAVALALFAGFKAIQSLFGGGGGGGKSDAIATDIRNQLQKINNDFDGAIKPVLLNDQQGRLDNLIKKSDWTLSATEGMLGYLTAIKDYSKNIQDYTYKTWKQLEMLPKSAAGGYFNKPTLTWVGEAGPEYVIPENQMMSPIASSGANPQGKGVGSSVYITINNEQNISGQAAMSPDQLADLFAQNVNEMTPKIKAALDRY